ncbi:MAG TPA: sulfurtransferase [Jatrophihabitantaceae bacterium]|nr:sulfurtransferase [Jatrophihabitantaceae bacterium]
MAADFGPLVPADWLAEHLDEVQVVDVRWYLDRRSGWDAYCEGHIPGAVWLDVDTDLSAPASPQAGRHPLPTEAAFAAALARKGIVEGRPVVAYDDAGGSVAARLWWLLHAIGEPAAVLDGGLAAWTDRHGELDTEVPIPVPAERAPRPWPSDRFVSADDLAASRAAVFDARSAERYAHGEDTIDPRPGHVPGARSAPWTGNLDAQSRFLEPDALRERFADAAGGAIAYCGSGVTACHDLLAMTLAGYTELALYPGSWSQWGADESRPTEAGTDSAPPR